MRATSRLVIRARRPHAACVEAEIGATSLRLEPRHGGFFEGFAPGIFRHAPYLLRVTEGATTTETVDPYAFGPCLGALDDHLLIEGTHHRLHQRLGAHLVAHEGAAGVRFAVWAPNARRVSVVGDFNGWDGRRHPMRLRQSAGVWELFVPRIGAGAHYKFEIAGADGSIVQKADPLARQTELPPATGSIVAPAPDHVWSDGDWLAERAAAHHAVVAGLHDAVLPLAFGAIFSGEAPLRAWLRDGAPRFAAALGAVRGQSEWSVLLSEDAVAHAAWLRAHDVGLAALAARVGAAGPGPAPTG
jgi:hypothetical protein